MASNYGKKLEFAYVPPHLETRYAPAALRIKGLLNKTNESGGAKYYIQVKKAKDGVSGFTANILDENRKSIFAKRAISGHDEYGKPIYKTRMISGHDEEEAFEELARVLEYDVNINEAYSFKAAFMEKRTDTKCYFHVREGDVGCTTSKEAIITLVNLSGSEVEASAFLSEWMGWAVRKLNGKRPKGKGSGEVNGKESGEDDEGESKEEGGHEKANQGKKRDKLSSGQPS